MARVAIESQAPAATQGPMENHVQDFGSLLIVVCASAALANPGVMLGGIVAAGWVWLYRPRMSARLLCALVLLLPLLATHVFVVDGWAVRDVLAHLLPAGMVAPVDAQLAQRSLYTEALAGPLWFEGVMLAAALRRRMVHFQVRRDHRLERVRWRAMSGRGKRALPDPQTSRPTDSLDHPPGRIRLALDAETGRPLDLGPDELAAHIFLPGASGSGKTTTVARLADGALANGYGVVIVDCKAGGLGGVARTLAERHGVPFYLVDPDDPNTLGYNPCAGEAAAVANKIVGAFSYAPAAEIYKNIAMDAVPVIVRGLQATGQPVTLDALYDAFDTRGMVKIAQRLPEGDALRRRLLTLGDPASGDRTGSAGRSGMQRRLGALLEGKFGALFRAADVLDWDAVLAAPSVTYIALSALASSEDVELMGRVVAQDMKQVCARRLRQLADGHELAPVLAVFDEFAALDEADQLADLLLQARQALMPVVVSTQYLPETIPLRRACLGAGLLIVHRVEAEDAERIAAQFGTRPGTEVTHQVDNETGYSEKGTVKRVEKFNVHPNELRNFAAGQAALKSVARQRYTIVRVYREP